MPARALGRLEHTHQLTADSERDALTGLLNRRAYQRFSGRVCPGDVLVLLDLDDSKQVNDTHGHLAGDQVLRVLGSVLHTEVRITEHALRLGGTGCRAGGGMVDPVAGCLTAGPARPGAVLLAVPGHRGHRGPRS
ncbi:hypothetical protein BH23ACT6_BH23ACT6_23610 [soil metagenome]